MEVLILMSKKHMYCVLTDGHGRTSIVREGFDTPEESVLPDSITGGARRKKYCARRIDRRILRGCAVRR